MSDETTTQGLDETEVAYSDAAKVGTPFGRGEGSRFPIRALWGAYRVTEIDADTITVGDDVFDRETWDSLTHKGRKHTSGYLFVPGRDRVAALRDREAKEKAEVARCEKISAFLRSARPGDAVFLSRSAGDPGMFSDWKGLPCMELIEKTSADEVTVRGRKFGIDDGNSYAKANGWPCGQIQVPDQRDAEVFVKLEAAKALRMEQPCNGCRHGELQECGWPPVCGKYNRELTVRGGSPRRLAECESLDPVTNQDLSDARARIKRHDEIKRYRSETICGEWIPRP
jgi:hypothetical protein